MSAQMFITKFAGLDQRVKEGENISLSPDMKNFRITGNYTLAKRPGIELVRVSPLTIQGLWGGYLGTKQYVIYATAGLLYRLDAETKENILVGEIDYGQLCMFEFDGMLYILTGNEYYKLSPDGVLSVVEGYVPLIAVGCDAQTGGGTPYEGINLITPKRRQQFDSDGTSTAFQLAETDLAAVYSATVNGEAAAYSFAPSTGKVYFVTPPAAGESNVEICYTTKYNSRDRIIQNKYAMLFGGNVDGRVFLWGHPDYSNYRFHSELAGGVPSAEYFPENNFTVVGNTEITDIVAQYDKQLIFTKDRAFYSYCELRESALGTYYSSFPIYNLNNEKGNLAKGTMCIMDNDPVTLCTDGLNKWVSTTVQNEKNAHCFSEQISGTIESINREEGFDEVKMFDHQTKGELLIAYKGEVFVYNYKLGVWYSYGDNIYCDKFTECCGEVYFSHGNTIYKFVEDRLVDDRLVNGVIDRGDKEIVCTWNSPYFTPGDKGSKKIIDEISLGYSASSGASIKYGAVPDSDKDWGLAFTGLTGSGSEMHYCNVSARSMIKRSSRISLKLVLSGLDSDAVISEMGIKFRTKGRHTRNGYADLS